MCSSKRSRFTRLDTKSSRIYDSPYWVNLSTRAQSSMRISSPSRHEPSQSAASPVKLSALLMISEKVIASICIIDLFSYRTHASSNERLYLRTQPHKLADIAGRLGAFQKHLQCVEFDGLRLRTRRFDRERDVQEVECLERMTS